MANHEITIYKCNYNYLISIGEHDYEMSNDANMPNGVNMYIGPANTPESIELKKRYKEIQLGDLPKGTLIGIIYRLQQFINWSTTIKI